MLANPRNTLTVFGGMTSFIAVGYSIGNLSNLLIEQERTQQEQERTMQEKERTQQEQDKVKRSELELQIIKAKRWWFR